MPVIYSPDELRSRRVTDPDILRKTVPMIAGAMDVMLRDGDILGASSYGSLFHDDVTLTCASDIDWLVVFQSSERMMRSAHWRTLLVELEQRNIHFRVPVLCLENLRSGNHTLSSLLHGVRYTRRRTVTGVDPVELFEQYGWRQNSVLTTLQLFGSFTRFFYEAYAYDFNQYHKKPNYHLLSEAVSIWKDIISSMIVACIPSHMTIEASWQKYAMMYATTFPACVLESGRKVYFFLEDLKKRMIEYTLLLESPTSALDIEEFCFDHENFLEAAEEIIPATAHFAEANIGLYRKWALTQSMEGMQSETSQQSSYAYNASGLTPILYGISSAARSNNSS